MNKRTKFLSSAVMFLLMTVMTIAAFSTSNRANAQTPYNTPTADAAGRIMYTVQPGEFCSQIQERTGVPISEIIRLNGLTEACEVFGGDEIVIGMVEVTPLPPTPTATTPPGQITPTLTPMPGLAEICVVLFHDMDGNGMRTEGEDYLYGGEVSINDRLGVISRTGTTVAGSPDIVDPYCFTDLPVGTYNISIAVPDDFNPTTVTNYPLEVRAGESATIDFGAQLATQPGAEVVSDTVRRVPILGIVGLIILLAGVGLGVYMWRSNKTE
ncbi:MAG: LysM peptidoglycan-binding domain-containing protein [Anaerolineaceae bacterium]|nr:LysM peptidoglycan-binding domain-containing protein [Anaerolineaceae bacterium]MDD4042789.1 LysM peptidoglycan-binding domain-containing protein [Anaerolineaceae bacterium]MDD4577386.1 LysM peptidoglycan-binding domain-containing protein [Anaerolineaceae bacterium]